MIIQGAEHRKVGVSSSYGIHEPQENLNNERKGLGYQTGFGLRC